MGTLNLFGNKEIAVNFAAVCQYYSIMVRCNFLRPLAAACALLVSVAVFAQDLNADQKKSILEGLDKVVQERVFVPNVDFKKWPEFVGKHKDEIEKATDVNGFTAVINRTLREFGITHIRLMSPRATANRGVTTRTGLGVTATKTDDGLEVRSVAAEGPAKEAGLEVGDVILKVNGTKPENTDILEGNEGERKVLEVKKKGGDTKTIEIANKKFSTVRKETLTWVNEETAMLKVFTFSAGYRRENIETLMKEAAKAKYFILDLRSNGGGAVNNLNHLLSLLLPDATEYGTFVSKPVVEKWQNENANKPVDLIEVAKSASNKAKTRVRTGVEPFKGKIAVLINRGSGSASEICAAGLRENAGAVLVGQKSAGAVLASIYAKLPEGFSLQHPVSDYVTIKGMRLEGNPLVPDAEASGAPVDGVDPVVTKALELLKPKSFAYLR